MSPTQSIRLSYLDFELEIGRKENDVYPVAVVRSPAGEVRGTMLFPFTEADLERRLDKLQIALLRSGGSHRAALSEEEQVVQEFGQELFKALFTGDVYSLYLTSRQHADNHVKGLRLKLRILAPEIAALPWEFLFDPSRGDYVCLSARTPVIRYLELLQPSPPLTVKPPLRILGMVASPSDLAKLDIAGEKRQVDEALQRLQARGLVEFTWLPGQTWRDLQQTMQGNGPWHIFHFIGHAGFDRRDDQGYIYLVGQDGGTDRLSARKLARLLDGHTALRLVLLNACEGGHVGKRDVFTSTATTLIQQGIPAVLAMQYEITDQAALEFARSFYGAIADGLPIDTSVISARKAISFAIPKTIEWGVPVLYMRSSDGVLFNIEEQEKADAERIAKVKAAVEAFARDQAEQERLAREQAERLAKQKAAIEALARKMKSDSQPIKLAYLDFELEIGPRENDKYSVAVVRSPAGEARTTMLFPFTDTALERRLDKLQIALLRSGGSHRAALSEEEQVVQEFGQELFKALFTGDVYSLYLTSRQYADNHIKGLRLKLRILAPEIAVLPWEFLFDPSRGDYVCLSARTPVIRYLELLQPSTPLTMKPPLRILGMVASPSDLAKLDIAGEKRQVDEALQRLQARGLVEFTWLPGQTWRDLQQTMQGNGPWHIFHFIGHAGFDRRDDQGYIYLVGQDGGTDRLSARKLARLLDGHAALRLVLLNACEGGHVGKRDIFTSTAATLIRQGLPAVLAMQYEITDQAALEFARSFYGAIADGLPIDTSVVSARKAISFAIPNTIEWGAPVLYMRSPDGLLFNIEGQKERLAQEKADAERLAQEKAAAETLAREQAERERLTWEKDEAELFAKQKAAAEALARIQAEQKRLAREKAEAEAELFAQEKATVKALAREQAEQAEWERLTREKAKAELLAQQKAAAEALAREQAEREQLAQERAETEPPAKQKVTTKLLPPGYGAAPLLSIEESIARIYNSQNTPIGAGFLVSDKQILTCAHVIASALDLGSEIQKAPSEKIRLDFPLIGTRSLFARVAFWDDQSDIAVLELPQAVTKAKPAPLLDESDLWGRPFRAFGFPRDREVGVWTAGVIRGPNASGWVQIEGEEVGYRIQPGFSGSPVWDESRRAVVGMIVATDSDSSVKVALFIPIARIAEVWPHIRQQPATSTLSTPPKKKLRIFLCHASADKAAVRNLYHRLLKDGYRPWLDEEDLIPGQRWETEIPKVVHSSDAIAICLSKNSVSKTGYIQKEIRYALDAADKKPENIIFLIPCRLEACEVPERLSAYHWVNLFQENGYSTLLRALETISVNMAE